MISVIITTFGGGEKLNRAINSVLNQSIQDFEIIVVDDNNPSSFERKKTEKIMKKFENNEKIHYIRHEKNMNGSAARNTGIAKACGDYITFLDDDDILLPLRLEKAYNCLYHNPEVDGVCTGVVFVENGYIYDLFVPQRNMLHSKDIIIDQSCIGTGSNIFFKTEIVKKTHGFDESFERFQDLEFMIRSTEISNVLYIKDVLIIKDVNENRELNYTKIKNSYDHFNKVFKLQLNELNDFELTKYYIDRYKSLLYIAKTWGTDDDFEDIKKMIKNNHIHIPKKYLIKNDLLNILKKIIPQDKYKKLKMYKNMCKEIKIKKKMTIEQFELIKELVR